MVRGHRPPVSLAIAAAALAAAAVALAACGPGRQGPTYPPAGATPVTATTETAAAREAVVGALASTALVIPANSQPYRPPEGAWFAGAPRSIVELDAPAGGPVGYVVLYGFGSSADAATAAADQAAFVSRATSRVYFASDSHFVLRVLGSAVVFLTWSPARDDARLAAVEQALDAVGQGVPIPA